MEDVEDWKGINGQLVTFKNEVEKAQKITLLGLLVYVLHSLNYWHML